MRTIASRGTCPAGARLERARPRSELRAKILLVAVVAATIAGPPEAPAQPCPTRRDLPHAEGWNSTAARDIAASAILARRHAFADSSLHLFRARAEGHVLFLADFGALAGQQLVRADQVALEIAWQAPGNSVQSIVGRRHLSRFPSRIRYHLDHLSLVLDNFRDRIEVGEGEEVRGVLHPAAEGALDFYQYRLTDSLGILLLGQAMKVYRLEVRPACPGEAGVVGTMDVDRDSRAIARLAFTFTAPSYVDPSVDYVTVELESGQVERRFWLPVEQRVEIRRQVNWLDFPLGGIIRTRFRITDFNLAPAASLRLRSGNRVVTLPDSVLELYAGWGSDLLAGPLRQRWRDSVSLDEVRRRALDLVRGRHLAGTARVRAHLPDVSGAIRGRRAEGLLLGAGLRWDVDGRSDVTAWTGYPLARERLEWTLGYRRQLGAWLARIEGYDDLHTDIGPFRAATGVVSSIGLAIRGEDFMDPYFRRGVALAFGRPAWGGRADIGVAWEEHTRGRLVADPIGEVRPREVRPIEEGVELRLTAAFERQLGESWGALWSARGQADFAAAGDFEYARLVVTARAEPPPRKSLLEWEASTGFAVLAGSPPPQRLALLGGRGTVPGYRFRGWGGDRAAFAEGAVALVVLPPWIRARAVAAVGWTDITSVGGTGAGVLGVEASDGVRPSLGAGLGLAWDLLRVEAVRGLDDGRWEWIVSLNPVFRLPL